MRLQALRGAITCAEDSKAEIDAKTHALVKEMLRAQRARRTTTSSASSSPPPPTSPPSSPRPRRAARSASATSPLLGAQELDVAARHAALRPGARALLLRAAPRRAPPRVPRRRGARSAPTSPAPTDGASWPTPKSVALVGTGLIGGSIGLALRRGRRRSSRGVRPRPGARRRRARRSARSTSSRPIVAAAVAGADLTVVAVPGRPRRRRRRRRRSTPARGSSPTSAR